MLKRLLLAFAMVLGLGQVAQAQTAVGPTAPVGPQATVTCPVGSAALAPGANIQSAVTAHPNGTAFCLAPGTYAKQYVKPKAGNSFVGQVGAILDGQNAIVRAFDGSAANVTIANLVIQNYMAGYQNAPVYTVNATGWKVLNNEIRNNAGVGVLFASQTTVQFNYLHHNLEMGYGSDTSHGGFLFDSNEIAYNNHTNKYDANEDGGGKIWDTVGAVLTHNYSHHNQGPGMWSDFNNIGTTYAYNRIEWNQAPGIMIEISYDASIHDNVIANNGSASKPNNGWVCSWLWCGQILIAASGGAGTGLIEIYNNQMTTTGPWSNGVAMVQQNRNAAGDPAGTQGTFLVQNIWVHDNKVDMTKGGNTGAVEDDGDTALFSAARNIKFDRNTYMVNPNNNKNSFWWNDHTGGMAFWQSFGFDLNGTFN